LWGILVLATLWLNCNFDFDKLYELANNHSALRLMRGYAEADINSRYVHVTRRKPYGTTFRC
jgi:hypothetical protein